MSEQFFCGLDIGSQTIKSCIIKTRESQAPEILDVYEVDTGGFGQASVSDLAELSECLHSAVSELTRKTRIKLKDVQLGLSAELVDKRRSTAIIPLHDRGNKVITRHDIRKIQEQARILGVSMDELCLHDFPQYYRVDDVNTAINPIGLYGRKLEMNTLLIVAHNTLVKNMTKAVNQAGYDVANMFFTSLASAEASLGEFARRQGGALVDIGDSLTSVLFFRDGQLKFFEKIPLGGNHITRSLANQLNVGEDLADDIKKSYGFALTADVRMDEEILIKQEDRFLPTRKAVICEAIEPVVTRLIDSVIHVLRDSQLYDQINTGIVLVGGGALLPGFPERLETGTGLSVKTGKIDIASRRLHNAAKYSSVIGLAQLGLKKSLGLSSHHNARASWASHVANRVKELYQEYF